MSTPFKMKGFGGFKSSPVKQAGNPGGGLRGMQGYGAWKGSKIGDFFETGIDVKGGNLTTETSFKPQFKVSDNVKIGTKFTGKSSKGPLSDPFSNEKSQTSLTGKLDFAGRRSNFKGSLSGEVGARDLWSGSSSKDKGKGTGSVKLNLGAGSKKHNIGAFAEHSSSKHISGGGTKFGIEGKTGVLKGSVGYNINTKKPEFKIGINI